MKELISVSVGGGGIQLSNACWELFCLEHRINLFGHLDRTPYPNDPYPNNQYFRTMFSEREEGLFVPRAVQIDLQSSVLDQVKMGAYKELFRHQNLISGKEDAASNYARGYYSAGKTCIDLCLEGIRREVERCDSMQGFLFSSAVGGGTGSGLGSLILERIEADFGKKAVLSFNAYPSRRLSHQEVEPYNTLLATRSLMQRKQVCTMMDNEALQDICSKNLEIPSPTYTNMNRIIAQTVSSITASIRFDGAIHAYLSELSSHLMPYPRINFILSSYSPIVNNLNANFGSLSATELCDHLFEPANLMARCDPRFGKFLACNLIFRGGFIPREAFQARNKVRDKCLIRFVDWSTGGFKVSMSPIPTGIVPGGEMANLGRSCCMIGNSTAIKDVIGRNSYRFDVMYARREFVHCLLQEGMEEGELEQARQELASLESDYCELEYQGEQDEGDFEE